MYLPLSYLLMAHQASVPDSNIVPQKFCLHPDKRTEAICLIHWSWWLFRQVSECPSGEPVAGNYWRWINQFFPHIAPINLYARHPNKLTSQFFLNPFLQLGLDFSVVENMPAPMPKDKTCHSAINVHQEQSISSRCKFHLHPAIANSLRYERQVRVLWTSSKKRFFRPSPLRVGSFLKNKRILCWIIQALQRVVHLFGRSEKQVTMHGLGGIPRWWA